MQRIHHRSALITEIKLSQVARQLLFHQRSILYLRLLKNPCRKNKIHLRDRHAC